MDLSQRSGSVRCMLATAKITAGLFLVTVHLLKDSAHFARTSGQGNGEQAAASNGVSTVSVCAPINPNHRAR